MKSLLLLILGAMACLADVVNYELIHEATLSGTSLRVTLSSPNPSIRTSAQVTQVFVWADADFSAIIRRDGSVPGGASVSFTPTKMNPQARNSDMIAHHTSDSTGGVALTPTYEFFSRQMVPIPFEDLYVSKDAALNLSVTITSTAGARVKFLVYYKETRP
jgi:hypothetical protein